MGFWTSYIGVGFGGRLDAFAGHGHVLLFSKTVVVAGLLVPALVLGGFIWTRRARYGPFFLLMTLVGVVIMAAGWPEGTPLRRGLTFTYNHAQALQFLRTTYKAGPLVALGLAVLGRRRAVGWRWRGSPSCAGASRWPGRGRAGGGRGVAARHRQRGRAPARVQAARGVEAARRPISTAGPDGSRALVEPGQLFAFQRWGGTIDNVLPALTDHPVATRYIVPFSDLRSADLQWGVDDLIGQERALPGQLRPLLDLMAVGDLVISADNDRRRGGGQGPLEAMAQLAPVLDTPGKDYGPPRRVQPAAGRIGTPQDLPAAAQRGARDGGDRARAAARAGDDRRRRGRGVAGLASYGELPDDRPLRYAGDLSRGELRAAAVGGATIVISDSNRRQAFVAARLLQNRGAVLPAGQDISQDGTFLDPFDRGPDAQTVAVQRGLARISSPFSPQTSQFPEHRPFAAVDGDVEHRMARRPLPCAPAPPPRPRRSSRRASVPYIDLLPYSDARGITRNVIVNGRLIKVHPGWNRLQARDRAARGRFGSSCSARKRPKTGSAGGGGIRELRVPGLKADELLRPPVLAEQALRGADLARRGSSTSSIASPPTCPGSAAASRVPRRPGWRATPAIPSRSWRGRSSRRRRAAGPPRRGCTRTRRRPTTRWTASWGRPGPGTATSLGALREPARATARRRRSTATLRPRGRASGSPGGRRSCRGRRDGPSRSGACGSCRLRSSRGSRRRWRLNGRQAKVGADGTVRFAAPCAAGGSGSTSWTPRSRAARPGRVRQRRVVAIGSCAAPGCACRCRARARCGRRAAAPRSARPARRWRCASPATSPRSTQGRALPARGLRRRSRCRPRASTCAG